MPRLPSGYVSPPALMPIRGLTQEAGGCASHIPDADLRPPHAVVLEVLFFFLWGTELLFFLTLNTTPLKRAKGKDKTTKIMSILRVASSSVGAKVLWGSSPAPSCANVWERYCNCILQTL